MRIFSELKRAQMQSGQAIVLMALTMVGLLGFTGLAVDGGGLFFLQRDAQNATDAAVIAATYARCTGGSSAEIVSAGIAAAEANGFYDGQDDRSVTVTNPPTSGDKAGDPSYVEVEISGTKPAYFIQVVYKGPLQVSTRAVGYCLPPLDPSHIPGIVGLSQTCTNVIQWSGSTGSITGGVFSNNDVQFTGSDNSIDGGGLSIPISAVTHIDNPASGHNTYTNPTTSVTGATVMSNPLAESYQIGDYNPSGTVTASIPSAYYHAIEQGSNSAAAYYDADFKNGKWSPDGRTLEGVYYVEGDVSLNNISSGPKGVTIVATGQIKGNAPAVSYYSGTGSTGVLFFSNQTDNCGNGGSAIDVSGNNTQWHGLVYAPNGNVKVSGSTLTLVGVIIAQQAQMSASEMILISDPSVIPPHPPLVKIAE